MLNEQEFEKMQRLAWRVLDEACVCPNWLEAELWVEIGKTKLGRKHLQLLKICELTVQSRRLV